MDGYSPQAMLERCVQDYQWENLPAGQERCRAEMMAHLYANPKLYQYTSMITFAEHYVLLPQEEDDDTTDTISLLGKPLKTFLQQKLQQPDELPIFAGVVWDDWQQQQQQPQEQAEKKLERYKQCGIEYVRLHCNMMNIVNDDNDSQNTSYFLESVAQACRQCLSQELVPVVLLQVPWRVPDAQQYYNQAIRGLVNALQQQQDKNNDDSSISRHKSWMILLETRPPIGISTQQETDMTPGERNQLGMQIGKQMVPSMSSTTTSSSSSSILPCCFGFCVAGGSTKGQTPTALQDDTQNAIRQGIRLKAKENWGYPVCYWEMGAKLMLQPKVGQLWWQGIVNNDDDEEYKDAAQRLFWENAKAMAEEIVTEL